MPRKKSAPAAWLFPDPDTPDNVRLQPPPASIDRLPSADDQYKARELWEAADRLREVCARLSAWWDTLSEERDADPRHYNRYRDAAIRSIRTLSALKVNLYLFNESSADELIGGLPPMPVENGWQKSPTYRAMPLLVDELWGLMKGLLLELETSPLTSVTPTRQLVQPKGPRLQIKGDRLYLDGEHIPLLGMTADNRPAALCYLRLLIEADGEWLSDGDAKAKNSSLPNRVDRLRKTLPPQVLALIETNQKKGHRLKV